MVANINVEAVLAASHRDGVKLSFFVNNTPESQPRPRARWMQSRVLVYDPSSSIKRAYKQAFIAALAAVGVVNLPTFGSRRVKVTAHYHVRNIRKDVDNMLKFTLDVLEDVGFSNDANVFCVSAQNIKPSMVINTL